MNKNRMILAVLGGVVAVAALAVAFLDYSAYSKLTAAIEGDEENGTDGLETVQGKAQQLSRSAIYPSRKSVKEIDDNSARVNEWRSEAMKLVSRGDKAFPKTTPAQFKTDLVAESQRLHALPGAVKGVFMKGEFAFGPFKEYIVEGKMPSEADLARLQRQWDDVVTVTEILSKSGAAELLDVQFKAIEEQKPEEDEARPKKKAKKGKGAKEPVVGKCESKAFSYVFTFTTRAPAFAKAVNALETCERFVVVNDFGFVRPKDAIAVALGGDEKKSEQASSGRRGRRARREVVEAPKDEPALKNGIITDPLLDEPFTVTMTLTVHDFGSLEIDETKEKKSEEE